MKRNRSAWGTLEDAEKKAGGKFRKVRNASSLHQYDSYSFRMCLPHYRKYVRMMKKEGRKDDVVPMGTYNKIVLTFVKLVMRKIILEGFIFNMPYRLGTIRMDKTPSRKKNVSVKTDMEKRRSWGNNYRVVWDKTLAKFPNKSLWTMDFYQGLCRSLKTHAVNEANTDPYSKGTPSYRRRIFSKRTTFKIKTPDDRVEIE